MGDEPETFSQLEELEDFEMGTDDSVHVNQDVQMDDAMDDASPAPSSPPQQVSEPSQPLPSTSSSGAPNIFAPSQPPFGLTSQRQVSPSNLVQHSLPQDSTGSDQGSNSIPSTTDHSQIPGLSLLAPTSATDSGQDIVADVSMPSQAQRDLANNSMSQPSMPTALHDTAPPLLTNGEQDGLTDAITPSQVQPDPTNNSTQQHSTPNPVHNVAPPPATDSEREKTTEASSQARSNAANSSIQRLPTPNARQGVPGSTSHVAQAPSPNLFEQVAQAPTSASPVMTTTPNHVGHVSSPLINKASSVNEAGSDKSAALNLLDENPLLHEDQSPSSGYDKVMNQTRPASIDEVDLDNMDGDRRANLLEKIKRHFSPEQAKAYGLCHRQDFVKSYFQEFIPQASLEENIDLTAVCYYELCRIAGMEVGPLRNSCQIYGRRQEIAAAFEELYAQTFSELSPTARPGQGSLGGFKRPTSNSMKSAHTSSLFRSEAKGASPSPSLFASKTPGTRTPLQQNNLFTTLNTTGKRKAEALDADQERQGQHPEWNKKRRSFDQDGERPETGVGLPPPDNGKSDQILFSNPASSQSTGQSIFSKPSPANSTLGGNSLGLSTSLSGFMGTGNATPTGDKELPKNVSATGATGAPSLFPRSKPLTTPSEPSLFGNFMDSKELEQISHRNGVQPTGSASETPKKTLTATKSDGPSVFANSNPQPPASGSNIFGRFAEKNSAPSSEERRPNLSSTVNTGDHAWKAGNPIKFGTGGNASGPSSMPAPAFTPATPVKANGLDAKTPSSRPFGGIFGVGQPDPTPSLFGQKSSADAGASKSNVLNKNIFTNKPRTPLFEQPAAQTPSTNSAKVSGEAQTEETAGGDENDNFPAEQQSDLTAVTPKELEQEEVVYEVSAARLLQYNKKLTEQNKNASPYVGVGTGSLRIFKNKETGFTRVMMRVRPAGHIILNCPLQKRVSYSSTRERVVQFVGQDKTGQPASWVVRVGKDETAKELAAKMEEMKG